MKISPEEALKNWDEFYGPIDGIRPLDHIETYAHLIASICIEQTNPDENIYISNQHPRKRLCQSCFTELGEPEDFELLQTKHTMCLIRSLNRPNAYCCSLCLKHVMKRKQGSKDCRECIEEYVLNPSKLIIENEIIVSKRY